MPESQLLLDQFQSCLEGGESSYPEALALISRLREAGLAELALQRFRRGRFGSRFSSLKAALEQAALEARTKRAVGWHLDTERTHVRLRYAKQRPLQDLGPAQTLALLADTIQAAGFALALGLGKKPRPMVTLGHVLPVGTEGLEEWVDVVLQQKPQGPASGWLPALRQAAPEGLDFSLMEVVPSYAQSALELARLAEWAWPCPEGEWEHASAKVAAFLAAPSFHLEKPGKAGGEKRLKQVEIRPLVIASHWESQTWHFHLSMTTGEAVNARKILGAILGMDPALLTGMVRRRIVLAEDPRLQRADQFEPKLKNIFEDAVLLGEASNLVIVDEDDDEPLLRR